MSGCGRLGLHDGRQTNLQPDVESNEDNGLFEVKKVIENNQKE